jgi:hypothetical protein
MLTVNFFQLLTHDPFRDRCITTVLRSTIYTHVCIQCMHVHTETDKGIPTWTLCQKNQGTLETKQKRVAVDDRTFQRTLSHERTPLQNSIDE